MERDKGVAAWEQRNDVIAEAEESQLGATGASGASVGARSEGDAAGGAVVDPSEVSLSEAGR